MAFQIKNFISIAASMINHVRGVQDRVTDFNVGSVARTMIEAPAIELDEAYQRLLDGIREAIPVATYNSFSFTRLPPDAATGVITVTVSLSASARSVPAGTVFSTPGSRTTYVTLADDVIAAGATTKDFLVSAVVAGVIGNIPAGQTFTAYPTISGMSAATNAIPFTTGSDEETDEQRKQRFRDYVSTLARCTVAALVYGAKTTVRFDANGAEVERVATANVVEPYEVDSVANDPGYINVYIHNGAGSTSTDLVNLCTNVLKGYTDPATGQKVPGYKAAGVAITVAAASEVSVNVTAVVTPEPGYDGDDLADAAAEAVTDYLWSIPIGGSYLEAEAIYRIKQIEGVLNITGLPADQTSTSSQKLKPGTIAVTAA